MSADIVSMYTSIHTDQGIGLITQVMIEHDIPPEKRAMYQDLLKWIFKNNYFTYRGTLYRQIRGAAMGSSCIPTFANLLMARIEQRFIFSKRNVTRPMPIYGRLIDDTIMVIERRNVEEWKSIFLECNQYLDFTFDCSTDSDSVPMLDLDIFLGPRMRTHRKLDYIGYQKPFNNNLYTAADSYCPDNYKFSWIIGENIRLIRNNLTKQSYTIQLEEYVDNLLKRGYDTSVILKHLKHSFDDRPTLLRRGIKKTKKDMIPIRIPHLNGYEHLLQAMRLYMDLAKCTFSLPSISPIILRAINLGDLANVSNSQRLAAKDPTQDTI